MIKKKRYIPLVAVVLVLATATTAAYAAGRVYANKNLEDLKQYVETDSLNIQIVDVEQRILEGQYNEADKQLKEYKKQMALQQNQVDKLNFQKLQYDKRRSQRKLIERYQLQVQYYNVCLLMRQLDFAQNELELINKQIEVEEEKLKQGLSTQLAVDDLVSRRSLASDNITSVSRAVELGKSEMKVKLNENKDIVFNPNFTIPSEAAGQDSYTLTGLTNSCKSNNLQLIEANAYAGYQNALADSIKSYVGETDSAYLTVSAELMKMRLSATAIDQSLGLYVEQQYNSFRDSLNHYNSMIGRKAVLSRQLQVIEERYNAGQISQLDRLNQRYNVLKELLDVDKAVVDKLNAGVMIGLVEQGIQIK